MKQRTHAWLAIRALGLLESSGQAGELVDLLKPHVASAAIGCWLPDLRDSKVGSGAIDNHVFKLAPHAGEQADRFVLRKADLFKKLGSGRAIVGFLKSRSDALDAEWWATPYRADPPPGQHLANRAMALTTTLVDQLLLGDETVANAVPGNVAFAGDLAPDARTRAEEVSTFFFMLSHFVADACQPCHCDARTLFGYDAGVHKELEAHWDSVIGTYFDKGKLMHVAADPDAILAKAREVDGRFGFTLSDDVPAPVSKDAWLEVLYLCRASFAVAGVLVSPEGFPYGGSDRTSFAAVFDQDSAPGLLADLDRAIMHDAVLNIAILWRDVWRTFD